jgi:uncharacterized integral membrane protein (TIGR00697 family)
MADPIIEHDQQRTGIVRKDFVLIFCVGLFMVSLVLAAITSVKIQTFSFGSLVVLVPAGSIAFGLTYLATDVISEVWGRATALSVVVVGLIMRFVMLALIIFAMDVENVVSFIGVADFWTPERQDAFVAVLGSSNRLNFAGMVAFGISALMDVLIFHHFRQRHDGKNLLWLRNNISTMASQAFNSVVFISVAFVGTVPLSAVGSLILGQVLVKIVFAAIDTPAIYLLRNWAEGRDLFDVRG